MIAELGHFLLILAFTTALYQLLVPAIGARRNDAGLMQAGVSAAHAQFLLVAAAFACLVWLYLTSDFSVVNVAANSHSRKPLLYKITGVWGNHEGSMLLWVLILSLFGAAVASFGSNLPLRLKARVLSIQSLIGACFLLFILAVSNPFLRIPTPPIEGNGLNPVLQDPALAIHPPFLYTGYVGLSVAFSFAVAALIEGRVDAAWARWVRPWTLAAWMFLTAGIALGSWWAYYELGWGGFWFWDPVENASFMPWLAATALLHSSIVVEKRGALKIWTVLLSILAFSLSLVGTFLVRSGVLTSVHAFAIDPARGIFILAILCGLIGGALLLYAWKAPGLTPGGLFAPISREAALVVNNLLLSCATAAVFIGTLYPLALEALTGDKISVGPPYYNLTFLPIIVPLLLLVPLGPMLSWKRADAWAAVQRLWAAALLSIALAFFLGALKHRGPSLAPLGVALGLWLVFGSFAEFIERLHLGKPSLSSALARLRGLPRSSLGMMAAHFGLGIAIIGIVAVTAWREEIVTTMKPGERVDIAGFSIAYAGEAPVTGPNYTAESARFRIMTPGGRDQGTLVSERRRFAPGGQTTTEAGISSLWSGDLYVVMGDAAPEGARVVRLYFNPLVSFIWLGAAVMFFGGLLSLSDRRLRIGAPKRRRALAPSPAE
jgi:cytochrome c-type biogenesis protein CcmF